jgi:hypothetical protein
VENPQDTLLCATKSHDATEMLRKLSQCETIWNIGVSHWRDEIKKIIGE